MKTRKQWKNNDIKEHIESIPINPIFTSSSSNPTFEHFNGDTFPSKDNNHERINLETDNDASINSDPILQIEKFEF